MNITLTKDLEKFVTGKVRSGGYASPDEVVREALRNFRDKADPAEPTLKNWLNYCCRQCAGPIVR